MRRIILALLTSLLVLSSAALAQCGPDGTPCDDGDPCTVGDVCINGVCTGTPINCDDGDPSTIDVCDPVAGCVSFPFNSFADFCSGDGGDQMGCTNCPCGNNAPPGTTSGCLNSSGLGARLLASGSPSVSLPGGASVDLSFSITGAPSTSFCILNSGDSLAPAGAANPCLGLGSGVPAVSFDGLRCAITNTRRHGGRSADMSGDVGFSTNPWGGVGGPFVGIANAGIGFVAGQTRYFQVIHRDDPTLSCMRGLNTSQAIEVTFTP